MAQDLLATPWIVQVIGKLWTLIFWWLSTATWHLLLLGPIIPVVPFNKPNSSLEISSPTDILDLHMRTTTKLNGTGNPLISKILVALVKVVSSLSSRSF